MKGWQIKKPFIIEESECNDDKIDTTSLGKIKITNSLITLQDVLRYNGDLPNTNFFIGSYGTGIISEIPTNLFGLKKGDKVYIEPNRECNCCYNCGNGKFPLCTNIQNAGEHFNGFMSDFTMSPINKLFLIPDNISDTNSLFIGLISQAINVIDKLQIQKGEYITVVGANAFGNIISQLLIYYQAIPILLASNEEDYNIAKSSGIYYCFDKNEEWIDNISTITSKRLSNKIIYTGDYNIPLSKAFQLAPANSKIAIANMNVKNSSISLTQPLAKQLSIFFINNGYGNTATSINLITNKALILEHLKINSCLYTEIPETFKRLNEELVNGKKIYETVVQII